MDNASDADLEVLVENPEDAPLVEVGTENPEKNVAPPST